jgi:NACHT domain/Restriction endonuclease
MRIRILESEANRRGDLFGRLMADVLLALGYDKPRLNVHKTGREVDIQAEHRTEPRIAIAECKATIGAVGGDALNKFAGVLDGERHRHPETAIQGYFVSLAGFRESAIEQEREIGAQRFVILDAEAAVAELVRGRIVIEPGDAIGLASRITGEIQNCDRHPELELLAHELGWLWCVYFTTNRAKTHFALIHAGGQMLTGSLAARVIRSDAASGGTLQKLQLCDAQAGTPKSSIDVSGAHSRYLAYLAREYGSITLEGLPADQEVGAKQIRLEELYVPLHVVAIANAVPDAVTDADFSDEDETPSGVTAAPGDSKGSTGTRGAKRVSVAAVLGSSSRLALLAPPGGGKSTLLKRLATAYAFPERRLETSDDLPERAWLPLIVRCRQLDAVATTPIREVLASIASRAEMPELRIEFDQMVSQALLAGTVLLLVDGLDEIASDSDRVGFVKQLRTFLATYPAVGVVVTSREPGFRVVGGALAHVCNHYRLAGFDDADIEALTIAWHQQVIGGGNATLNDAKDLAAQICATDRVRRLAVNPLLLTTLLLVKRWLGDLPRKRSVLYAKAIEVLLMTWNVEGHEPIDQDEALPQLAYLAAAMSMDGMQTISGGQLRRLIAEARTQLPELLAYATTPIPEFVRRIEDRSSVLSLSGHGIEDGRITTLYEFKHLTFQEYLTGLAVVEGFVQEPYVGMSVADVLAAKFRESTWREIIPLAAVIAGRHAGPIIQRLIDETVGDVEPSRQEGGAHARAGRKREPVSPRELLARCLGDEVKIAPGLVEESCRAIARGPSPSAVSVGITSDLVLSRYGNTLLEAVRMGYCGDAEAFGHSDYKIVGDIAIIKAGCLGVTEGRPLRKLVDMNWPTVAEWTASDDLLDQALGNHLGAQLAFAVARFRPSELEARGASTAAKPLPRPPARARGWPAIVQRLREHLGSETLGVAHSACLFAVWALRNAWIPDEAVPEIAESTFRVWRLGADIELRRVGAWAFASLPLLSRDTRPLGEVDRPIEAWLRSQLEEEPDSAAVRIAAYYFMAPWDDEELRAMCTDEARPRREVAIARLAEVLSGA